jgi:hypothetical protein
MDDAKTLQQEALSDQQGTVRVRGEPIPVTWKEGSVTGPGGGRQLRYVELQERDARDKLFRGRKDSRLYVSDLVNILGKREIPS